MVNESALQFFEKQQYGKATVLLEKQVREKTYTLDTFQLLAKCYAQMGHYMKAIEKVKQGLSLIGETPVLWESLEYYKKPLKLMEEALKEISKGGHTSSNINFLKKNIKQLITYGHYAEAVTWLSQATEVRKHKTTTILWIGMYLKDIFLLLEKGYDRYFDELLLDEMLFYYLKSGKMYERGFKEIQAYRKEMEV
ncbi:hypothetical protein [Algivirga pacifica]|uniref:Tetratricopeptide repeat-containing protein n=1 Tax=Algivirga pacifica TaxID=1162670 RepID=A0ABP9DCK2_9BACT